MINRYKDRRIVKNTLDQYSKVFKDRNVNFIQHYVSPKFNFLTAEQYSNIRVINHFWKEGDRFYKLSEKYYDDPTDWWVIAKFNLKPTESHVQVGDIIKIPIPLDLVLEYMTG